MNQDSVHMLSYASSRIKLIQIICGFVIWSLLCTQWGGSLGYGLSIDWSSNKCSADYRLYFCAAMSLAVLVFMIISKLSLLHANLERMLSVVFYILNSAAIIAIMWYWLANSDNPSHISISLMLCIMQFVIGMVDVKCSFERFRLIRNNL
uniref:Transmembrane protein n=1 Tax=Ditylenchus dipsaci TaxID=166011 RepID=A0A915CPE6_9BILA